MWLAKGAPARWFAVGAGFGFERAPTRVGHVSYNVTVQSKGKAEFSVALHSRPTKDFFEDSAVMPWDVLWRLRWPFPLSNAPALSGAVELASIDLTTGIAAVTIQPPPVWKRNDVVKFTALGTA